jgi:hypothetical protein
MFTPLAAAGVLGVARAGAALAATAPNLIGYTAIGSQSCEQLDALTGRTAQVVRVYHVQGTPVPTALNASLRRYLGDEGRHVVYSLKVPDSSSATYHACDSLAADIAAKGYAGRVWIVLWHEPYPEFTAAAYIARYRALAPAIRNHGVPCGVCFHTYPIWRKGLDYTTYWPGDDLTDFMGIDTYPGDTAQGLAADPLATISPLTSYAKSHGKTFGVAEFAVPAADAAADPADAAAWIGGFERLGGSCRFTMYWNGSNDPYGLEYNNGMLIPAYQRLYDRFD